MYVIFRPATFAADTSKGTNFIDNYRTVYSYQFYIYCAKMVEAGNSSVKLPPQRFEVLNPLGVN